MKRHPIITGTDSNHGMSAKIISIIQMLLAWALLIMVAHLTLLASRQDTIKVIMVTRTSTMTTAGTSTAAASAVEAEVEATSTADTGTAAEAVTIKTTVVATKTRTLGGNTKMAMHRTTSNKATEAKLSPMSMSLVAQYAPTRAKTAMAKRMYQGKERRVKQPRAAEAVKDRESALPLQITEPTKQTAILTHSNLLMIYF